MIRQKPTGVLIGCSIALLTGCGAPAADQSAQSGAPGVNTFSGTAPASPPNRSAQSSLPAAQSAGAPPTGSSTYDPSKINPDAGNVYTGQQPVELPGASGQPGSAPGGGQPSYGSRGQQPNAPRVVPLGNGGREDKKK